MNRSDLYTYMMKQKYVIKSLSIIYDINSHTERLYHIFLYNYSYTNRILVTRHPDDGHTCDRNIFVKNNMWLNTFVQVHFSINHVTT